MLKKHRYNTQAIADLAFCLRVAYSPLICVQLAHELGYQMLAAQGGGIELSKRGVCRQYVSADALKNALLGDARRIVGRS